jgi:hypothetical protein
MEAAKGETVGRVRYNRAHLSSAGPAAQKLAAADGRDRYVFATAYGYTIALTPPPFGQSHVKVRPDGTREEIVHNFGGK